MENKEGSSETRFVPASTAKILLVESDAQARRQLRRTLTSSGYTVIEARTGEEACEEFCAEGALEVTLVKATVPGSFSACRRIRHVSKVPILVIGSGRSQNEVVQTFDSGADDYLAYPFRTQELLARILAMRRRALGIEAEILIESSGLRIDFARRRVSVTGRTIHLTPTEYEVLRCLVLQEGKPVAYPTLLQSLWGPGHEREIQRLRIVINQLRRKIELNPEQIRYIHTQYEFGYRFEPTPRRPTDGKRTRKRKPSA